MSDRDSGYQWTTSISGENNIRLATAKWHAGDEKSAKEMIQYMIDNTYDQGAKQFLSGIDRQTGNGIKVYIVNVASMLNI